VETFDRITRNFYAEAQRLKAEYKTQIELLVGFETEWIRSSSLGLIKATQKDYQWDIFVGSVHHVHTIPIDYDRTVYERARLAAGGTDKALFGNYFDAQYEMLQAIKPPVVGHLDVIRLFSDHPNKPMREYDDIFQKILRNLTLIKSYDGVLEINTSAFRKGLEEPYPQLAICQVRFSASRVF
jgi:histidinol-phosphatase (PHP family)